MASPKSVQRNVALLRGINVGGKNIIKMVDLRTCFEELAFTDVQTYIQSGNVVFSSKRPARATLTKTLEAALGRAFGYAAPVVLLTAEELARVVAEAPEFGKRPTQYRYDVVFVKPPLTPAEALSQVVCNPGVDEAHAGGHAVYFRRLIAKATRSHLPRLLQQPAYKSVTIRNWNTTTKLLALVSTALHP